MPDFARIEKRRSNNRNVPIGVQTKNPIFDTMTHDVESIDGHEDSLSTSIAVQNILNRLIRKGTTMSYLMK